jgi:adenylosuccinate synthase
MNPMTFRREYEELEAMGFAPKVYAHWNCRWSTPYDMILNQILEDSRGNKRHGSCGMGIWETIVRYNNYYPTCNNTLRTFNELILQSKFKWLKDLREEYFEKRLQKADLNVKEEWKNILYSDALLYHFISDIRFMCNHITWTTSEILQSYDTIVFENGQGLLLDQNQTKYGDNTTPSNTGIKNPHEIIENYLPNANVEVCYVTRTYMTRHGVGNFESECNKAEINSLMEDRTNVPNQYQGSIRYGWLNVNELIERIKADIRFTGKSGYEVSVAVTHINEFENKELLNMSELNVKYLSCKETRKMMERK